MDIITRGALLKQLWRFPNPYRIAEAAVEISKTLEEC
jgi:hypothetical protein